MWLSREKLTFYIVLLNDFLFSGKKKKKKDCKMVKTHVKTRMERKLIPMAHFSVWHMQDPQATSLSVIIPTVTDEETETHKSYMICQG